MDDSQLRGIMYFSTVQSTALVLVHAGLIRYHFHESSARDGIISHDTLNSLRFQFH